MPIQHIAITAKDNEAVAAFYQAVFGMVPVHRTYKRASGNGGIYLSDGNVNLAILVPSNDQEGINHFGFQVADLDAVYKHAKDAGGDVRTSTLPRDGRFAEGAIIDPVGTRVDVAVNGWQLQP